MTTTVHVSCSECHRVSVLLPKQVTATQYGSLRAFYGFQCAMCDAHVCKPADSDVLEQLRSAGIKPRLVLPSPAPTVDGEPPDGPPLTDVDVADLVSPQRRGHRVGRWAQRLGRSPRPTRRTS